MFKRMRKKERASDREERNRLNRRREKYFKKRDR